MSLIKDVGFINLRDLMLRLRSVQATCMKSPAKVALSNASPTRPWERNDQLFKTKNPAFTDWIFKL
ncbi:hypothetical protein SAMN05421824_2375 [Hyunsoonleella jejuensis]|uniref:Uncharacterized protein n=1 Tax=Hyunsoonleella jejuensis TaxID=419940 RepID=A0A1H9J2Q1_9FLAO|nr:hypothetical protein SAMN05421824_2375 [Hyunsoonleella jejuensis]